MELTTADFDRMTANDEWLGFGYLGARRNTLTSNDPEAPADPALVAAADAKALAEANRLGLTHEQLFDWANSRVGRYYGDCMFGNDGQHADDYLPGKTIPERRSR